MTQSDLDPYFKGWLHCGAASLHAIIFPLLLWRLRIRILALYFYSFMTVVHFAVSGIFHRVTANHPHPSSQWWFLPLRISDHISIYLTITSTYQALISTVVPDISLCVQILIWGITLGGAYHRMRHPHAKPLEVGLPFLLLGWCILLDPITIVHIWQRLPRGVWGFICAGCCHTIGAMIYMGKRPNLWPQYVEYHELFHCLTTTGSIITTYVLFTEALNVVNEE